MKILILGGTVFLGRHLVEAARGRGHEVTLFNRGKSGPGVFEDLEQLRGDRDGDLDALRGRRWDAVIDTCGYVPRIVGASAELLRDAVGRYVFVSSLSVYADAHTLGVDESGAVAKIEDETAEAITGETYGALKALCEAAVETTVPGRTLVVRPGLIVGPHDPTDRFTTWPVKIAAGGPVLAPPRDAPAELTDVRDLSEWIVSALEAGHTGVFNVSGPAPGKTTFGELLDACRAVSGGETEILWASEAFLKENAVEPWSDLPVWVGSEAPGSNTRSSAKAIAAGLRFRPVADTVQDTLAWASEKTPDELKAGLAPVREATLIARWREASSGR